jgi:peptidoglycan/LPS O-acetylase OafA/YrhL
MRHLLCGAGNGGDTVADFGIDSKHSVGWLAGLRGAGGDVAALGTGSLAQVAFAGHAILYIFNARGERIAGFCYLQQTLAAIVFIGLISSTLSGFSGVLGRVLGHSLVRAIGRLSFGLYLFHTPVPLLLGWIMPFLWHPFFSGPWVILRLFAFGLTSWGLAFLCWKYLEGPPPWPRQRKI